ncbi:hypothetical protein K501DRAFT_164152, partial [Backusella circina FSU 941]
MKFGLNLQKKKTLGKPILNKKNAFGDQSDSEDEQEPQTTQNAKNKINKQLTSYNTMTKKIEYEQKMALKEDPNIFDYDAVYDDLKEAERVKKEALKGPATKKAKYITGLLEMAEIRKRDRILAEEKKVAREREAEGDEFADKEVFVTESFKKQKEELERIEREERQREELAAKTKTMDSFYKQVLERKEAEHRTVMEAMSKNKNKKVTSSSSTTEQQAMDATLAKEAKKKGKEVELNDNNEIIDKRQLLGAGLNVKSKFGSLSSLASSDERIKERMDEYNEYKQKKLQEARNKRRGNDDERERLSREVERQMMENKKQQEEEELRKQKELEEKATAKRTNEDAAMSARERFLARKKQKLEEESKK